MARCGALIDMTLETALIAGISAVSSALVIIAKILWGRSNECERDRRELRTEIEKVKMELGRLEGKEEVLAKCPLETCPWKAAA